MDDWYTQYTTPMQQLGQNEGTTCQRTRFLPYNDGTFGMYSTDTNERGQFRDSCGKGEEAYPESNVGKLSITFPGAPTVTITVVSCQKSCNLIQSWLVPFFWVGI